MANLRFKTKVLELLLVSLVALAAVSEAQDVCDETLLSLIPCVSFVDGNSEVPSQECCTVVGTVTKDNPVCFCRLVGYDTSGDSSFNVTQARSLPFACSVNFNVSTCPELVGESSKAPTPTPTAVPNVQAKSSSGVNAGLVVGIVVAGLGVCFIGAGITFCFYKRRERKPGPLLSSSSGIPNGDSSRHPSDLSLIVNKHQRALGTRFTYDYLSTATNGFSKELGRGAFGVVYQGTLEDNSTVAVKSLLNTRRGLKNFEAEIKTLGNINHVNLVVLKGFCVEPNGNAHLVYEFVQNGSLDKWLFSDNESPALPWNVRMDVARGTSKGLAYLHEDLQTGQYIIHLDIKPGNILLDSNFTPKVADFGMAKLLGETRTLTIASGGTFGYMAPETYAGTATKKMDVYSFGMVLLELVCGRRHLKLSLLPGEEFYLPSWCLRKVLRNEEGDVVDLKLKGVFESSEVRRLIVVGLICLFKDPDLRHDMGTVWRMIEGLTPVPEIPEELKMDIEGVEKILRQSMDSRSSSDRDS